MNIPYYEHASRTGRKIALTFDDGPNPPRTDQVIEILNKYDVRGTFFVLGKWMEKWPQAAKRLADSQHIIGNHGYSHNKGVCDYSRAESAIGNITGKPSKYIRAPYFDCNSYNKLHQFMVDSTERIHCDIYTNDFDVTDSIMIAKNIMNNAEIQAGSILLFHDGSENADDHLRLARPMPMIYVLPTIIQMLQDRGFELVGLDDLEFHDPKIWEARETNT